MSVDTALLPNEKLYSLTYTYYHVTQQELAAVEFTVMINRIRSTNKNIFVPFLADLSFTIPGHETSHTLPDVQS